MWEGLPRTEDTLEAKIERYVRRYAIKHGITTEQAKEHEIVKNVIEMYTEQEKHKVKGVQNNVYN